MMASATGAIAGMVASCAPACIAEKDDSTPTLTVSATIFWISAISFSGLYFRSSSRDRRLWSDCWSASLTASSMRCCTTSGVNWSCAALMSSISSSRLGTSIRANRCGRATTWNSWGMALNASDIEASCIVRKLGVVGTSFMATFSRMRSTSLFRYCTPVPSSTVGTLRSTVRSGLVAVPLISTVSCLPIMSWMISDIRSSPTLARPNLKLSIRVARLWVACSIWVDSCTPDVALPCWPWNPAVMPLARWIPMRASPSILYCCSLSW